ncbi:MULTISPECIES: multicopper oxidase family protein [Bacillus cereus group]|uniref:Multicopper oxidase domain-containing protein n=2 Tax=Bacillus cereus group TaxID=86661 RepID=A0ABV3IAF1_9BACI|nr:multicopper oxidase [Bacillus cereus group sp. N8]MBJ8105998.1 multicopper oxidase domain-containing protein [Bacillus cereus group sp. N8]
MSLEKFVDALPIPSVLKAKDKHDNIPFYEVTMKEVKQKLHRDLPPTTVWGYNGMYPGPTFEVQRNHPILVKWKNKLPFEHLLPVDRTIHGAEPDKPSVRTVVHLHEGRVRPENDGYPEAWFTRNFENVGPKFVHEVYYYPNCQRPATLWYHDHALGITRLNVYAGLAGFYLLRDKEEEKLNLPNGKFEIPLVIQDRSFYPNGELFYPTQPGHEPPPAPQPPPPIDPTLPNPSVVPEFFGNTILVNGKVWPYLAVEPRKYRFRILNGSNARFYRIKLSSAQDFVQIGTEGGLLEKPIIVSEIILAPAERVDVIIDFSNHRGQSIILTNDAPAPFPNGDPPSSNLTQIMEFRVKQKLHKPDNSKIPKKLSCLEHLDPNDAVTVRKNLLVETTDEFGRLKLLLNNLDWHQLPLTETPYNGTIEIWELYNTTPDTHPIHLHLVTFQILNRATFTGDPNGPDLIVGPPQPPDPSEMGWKDTVRANPGEVTRIIARFGPFIGIYPWHCHILEHEDHDMMRPYEVLDNQNFNPCEPIPGECPDDSFAQCFNCDNDDDD